jgi:hypothetical protein
LVFVHSVVHFVLVVFLVLRPLQEEEEEDEDESTSG